MENLYGYENVVLRQYPKAIVEKEEGNAFRIKESTHSNARVLARGSSALAAWKNAAKYVSSFHRERVQTKWEQG